MTTDQTITTLKMLDDTGADAEDKALVDELWRVFCDEPGSPRANLGCVFVDFLHALGYVWALPRYVDRYPLYDPGCGAERQYARNRWKDDLSEMFESPRLLTDIDLFCPKHSVRYLPSVKLDRYCCPYRIPVNMRETRWIARVVRDLLRSCCDFTDAALPSDSRLARLVTESRKKKFVKIGDVEYGDHACLATRLQHDSSMR